MSFYTVKSMSMRHDFTQPSLRSLIFHSKTNGLLPAIKRVGRKVLIDEMKFYRWIEDPKCLVREEKSKDELD